MEQRWLLPIPTRYGSLFIEWYNWCWSCLSLLTSHVPNVT